MFLRAFIWSTLVVLLLEIKSSGAVVPSYLPLERQSALSRLQLITEYFYAGFKYFEIVLLLCSRHNINISIRHLKRILKTNNLRRRNDVKTPLKDVEDLIRKEIKLSGQCIGYRSMWRRLIHDYKIQVKRNDVMRLIREVDPEGVSLRKAHKLKRRRYCVRGPNYVWHVDGYDKLKPFGLCIHGSIDGYSRRIMWLEVGASNNNPKCIAYYYLETVNSIKCAPRILRTDCGTENSYLSFLQPLLRRGHQDSMAGLKSFMYGKSTANQRIEAWWGHLRRQGIHWWIIKLKDLRDRGRFNAIDPVHIECVRFCLMDVLQAELDRIAQHWNLHNIRTQKDNTELPCGKPDILYYVPELHGGYEMGKTVDVGDLKLCQEMYTAPKQKWCAEFFELAYCLKPDLQVPCNADDGFKLYEELISLYEQALLDT